ncbi:hypothetical protein V8B97DRAFT_1277697 [Scleroderma yunnanense]
MDQFRKFFKLSGPASSTKPLKHSKSMPLRSGAKAIKEEDEHKKPVYRGKGPLKTSDLTYVEQIPGMLDIPRSTYQNPSRPGCHSSYLDLLDRFPSPPGPPPIPPRSPLRSMALDDNTTDHVVNHPTRYPPIGQEPVVHRSVSVTSFSYPTSTVYTSPGQPRSRLCREFPISPAGPIPIDEEQEAILQQRPPVLGSVTPRRARRFLSQSQDTYPTHAPVVLQRHRPLQNHPNLSSYPALQGCRPNLRKPSSTSLRSRAYTGAGLGQ